VTSPTGEGGPGSLDLTVGEPPEKLPLDRPLALTPGYNPRRVQERVRTSVATAIVGALIALTLILAIAYVAGRISAKDLPQVTAALVTPLVGIAGTVLGFYFGSHRPDGGPEI
jgi:ABC-type Fe3+ transport system permease subunit